MIFIGSFLVSFLGSLQVGLVNVAVIDTCLHQNKKQAMWVALGGSIPEFGYSILAVFLGVMFLDNKSLFFRVFQLIAVVCLFFLAFYYFFKKTNAQTWNNEKHTSKTPWQNFAKGFILGTINPQLLLFWIFVQVFFNSYDYLTIKDYNHKFAFVSGAGLGAFALLSSLAVLVNHYNTVILRYITWKNYNKFLAIIFFCIGIQQFFSLFI